MRALLGSAIRCKHFRANGETHSSEIEFRGGSHFMLKCLRPIRENSQRYLALLEASSTLLNETESRRCLCQIGRFSTHRLLSLATAHPKCRPDLDARSFNRPARFT